MSATEQAAFAVRKCLAWLAATQDDQGGWTGALRSPYCLWYAAGLAIDGEASDSAVIADICEYLESCIREDGGVAPYPGEPSTGFDTATAIPLFTWAGRDPAIVRRASGYLRTRGEKYGDATNQFLRWVFEPEHRSHIGSDRGPHSLVLYALLLASRKHPTTRWKLEKKYPHSYKEPSASVKKLAAFLVRALTYPPAGSLAEGVRVAPQPIGFETALFTTAAIRELAGDTSADAKRLIEFALNRRRRFSFAVYAHDWVAQLVADLFFTQSLGLKEEYARASAALRSIRYEGKGWLRGIPISINIFDTALTLQALHTAGFSKDEPMTQRARDFLLAARRPADGMWSWAYDRRCSGHPGQPDTDDSGAACVALAQLGEATTTDVLKNAAHGITSLQEKDGSFSTFGQEVLRPNWCYVSNTSRAIQGLLAAGVDCTDERVQRAFRWLRSQQLPDGSWVDGWCARYIYGTAIALEALTRASTKHHDPAVERARDWLIRAQNADGGWGENWYGASSHSTSEHTGLALRALCLIEGSPCRVIESGVRWLVKAQRDDGAWDSCYFVEFGFDSGFADSQLPVVWALHGLGSAIRVLEGSPVLIENRVR